MHVACGDCGGEGGHMRHVETVVGEGETHGTSTNYFT